MNSNINTKNLIEKLSAILVRVQNDEITVPHTEAENKMFSAGYAEAISDVLSILHNDRDVVKEEIDFDTWKVIDDDAWWDDAKWDENDEG